MDFDEYLVRLLLSYTNIIYPKVAICAGCNIVHPYAALIVGLIAGAAYMAWSMGMLRVRIDDPIDAVAGQ